MATALEQFNYLQFKAIMNVADIDDAMYSLIIRGIFDKLLVQYEIDIDNMTEVTSDLIFAVYRHAKFIFEVSKNNLDVVDTTSDPSGNKTTFDVKTPKDVMSTYKMYSPVAPALL